MYRLLVNKYNNNKNSSGTDKINSESFIRLMLQNDYSAGVLEQIKSQICSNVTMYAEKYEEEFSRFLPNFVTDIWNLLRSLNKLPKYDLVSDKFMYFYYFNKLQCL